MQDAGGLPEIRALFAITITHTANFPEPGFQTGINSGPGMLTESYLSSIYYLKTIPQNHILGEIQDKPKTVNCEVSFRF